MISNAAPWDNLKFNAEGIDEVRRKFFGTLYNTYTFFVMYANIDGFVYAEADIDIKSRPEIDQWIISLLNSLSKEVDSFYADFEPTKAARAIQEFVDAHLSNWYVRLSRRRFWRSDNSDDKLIRLSNTVYLFNNYCKVDVAGCAFLCGQAVYGPERGNKKRKTLNRSTWLIFPNIITNW